jgi:hypothetical protein
MESRTVCWDLISLWELTVSYQHGGWFKFGIPCRFRKPSKTKYVRYSHSNVWVT